SSAITGIAIDKGILKSTDEKVFELLPQQYRNAQNSDKRKALMNIADLLTMSSGLDAIDFGIDTNSIASEDNYQSSKDWIKTIVEAPMVNEPGTHANYGSANPYLLGVALNEIIKDPLELFIDNNLFSPLGISNYIIPTDCFDHPYFAGGMMMTSRDMLKFGQLYLDKGNWKGNVIVSSDWVDRSFKKYRVLENTTKKNEYGYLWWHQNYKVGADTIQSIEARGAGGQYIFVIPKYNLVAVITSGNFRNGRVWQPEKVMENYILPALIQ
ncbi:MAG: serine hydrolase, partial [bacterium]